MNEFYYTYMVITFAGISWASLELAWGEYIEQKKGNVAAMGFGWAVWLFMLGWGLLS